mmetsp:Transcript_5620/g.8352  ORF Transcript_5620/g.8352 Transcript_5620/m.8352 type:complete len:80 (-) Transcript_5620:76-315(-)
MFFFFYRTIIVCAFRDEMTCLSSVVTHISAVRCSSFLRQSLFFNYIGYLQGHKVGHNLSISLVSQIFTMRGHCCIGNEI